MQPAPIADPCGLARHFAAAPIAAVAALVLVLSACNGGTNVPEQRPADFRITFSHRDGSVPPPHHTEYDITIHGDGSGTIVYRPDYPMFDSPEWKVEFQVSATDMDALWRTVRTDVFDRSWRNKESGNAGGDQRWLTATATGQTVKVPSEPAHLGNIESVYEQIHVLVPSEVWEDLRARRDEYVENYEERE